MQITKVSSTLVQVLPDGYDPNKNYPLIIFAHGAGGQWGIDALFQGELPDEVKKAADVYNMIVLAPWTSNGWQLSHYDSTVAYAKGNLPVDWKRVYLYALSLGGQMIGKVISTSRANDLACTVLACGVNNVTTGQYVAAAGIATLFFHAADDGTVGVKNSEDAVSTINASNPPIKAKLIKYTNGQHWIWGKVFSTTERPWTGNEAPATVHEYALMNTTDKSVEVPMLTVPTGLKAVAAATVKDGLINLDGTASTGYDNISWTDISPVKSTWVGGTGWKTAVSKPSKSGTYAFELKVSKAGVSERATVSVDFQIGAEPVPTKTVKSWDEVIRQLTFSDGSTEAYTNLIRVVGDPGITFKTATGTYNV